MVARWPWARSRATISLWSLRTRRSHPHLRVHLPGHRGPVINLVYDPHGSRLASAGADPLVEVWDLEVIDRELSRLELSD